MKKQLIMLPTLTLLLLSMNLIAFNHQTQNQTIAIYETKQIITEHFFLVNDTGENKFSKTWDFLPNADLNITIEIDSNSSSNVDMLFYELDSIDGYNLILNPGDIFTNNTKAPDGYDVIFALAIILTLSADFVNASGNIEINMLDAGGQQPVFIGIDFILFCFIGVFIFGVFFIIKKRKK